MLMKKSSLPVRSFLPSLCLSLAFAGLSQGAVLYTISSFDPTDAANVSSKTVNYDPSLVAITTNFGLIGTTAVELGTLQTVNTNLASAADPRFRNTDIDAAQTNGTLVADTNGYFQFGVSGGMSLITLTDLTFNAKKATASVSTRGYAVTASVNGGAYTSIGTAANLTADRSAAPFDTVVLSLAGAQFQNISSIDFRVKTSGGGVEYANFTVNGAVPEPSAAILGALSLAGLLTLRRRG